MKLNQYSASYNATLDSNESWQKKNRGFWNVMKAKDIKNLLNKINDKWGSLSEDKTKKVNMDNNQRRNNWIGNLIKNNMWITTIIEKKIEDKPGRVKSMESYIKQIMLNIKKGSNIELKEIVLDWEEWRNI